MLCPTCGYLLQKLSVTTNSGGKFDIEHCGRCGGTWFDPYEINRIPYHEVMHLAKLTVLPKTPQPQLASLFCPRCQKELAIFHSESVPRNVRLFRCPKCHGIWATQKALEGVKKYQEDTILKYKQKNLAFPSLSMVFVPALVTLAFFLTSFVTVLNLESAKDNRTKAQTQINKMVVLPTSVSTLTVSFQTTMPQKSSISYGLSSLEMETKTITSTFASSHQILISHLKPNSVYIYQITLEDNAGNIFTTPISTFTTPSR